MMRSSFAFLVGLVVLGALRSAYAHPSPHSVVLLDLRASDVGAELRLPIPELEAALGRAIAVESDRDTLRQLVARDLHVTSPDGAEWTVTPGAVSAAADEQSAVAVIQADLVPPSGYSPRAFTLTDDVIGRDVRSHTAWIALRGDRTLLGTTRYLHHRVTVDREQPVASRGFCALFQLGRRHIAEGTDHLLFLFALLLSAPLVLVRGPRRWQAAPTLGSSVVRIVRIVSAFTLGHSLTLLIGALGWLRLPSALVEALIAVSILVSALHAVSPLFPGREAWIAVGFGWVHGLAFASALSELGLDRAHLALALLGFNLGIEAMQLVIVALTFPWLLLLAKTRYYAPFRVLGAALAALAVLGWIGERALHWHNPFERALAGLTSQPALLLGLLAGLTLWARAREFRVLPNSPGVT